MASHQSAPRSLADELRGWSDDALVALLRARPDLLTPVPSDLAALAARAASPPSVSRALERCDTFVLQTVEVLCALGEPTTAQAVADALGADPARPLEALRTSALVIGEDAALRVVRTLREVVGPTPAGLGPALETALSEVGTARLGAALAALGLPPAPDPPTAVGAIRQLLADPRRADEVLDGAPAGVRDVLDRLTWGPPVGELPAPPRIVLPDDARTPVEWLASRCLVAVSGVQVVLPRELGLHLRGGRVHATPQPQPPALITTAHDRRQVDRLAGQQAFTAVRHVEELLEAWAVDGPAVLRAGGLGVRELRRTAAALDIDEPTAALMAELAYAAGLLGPGGALDDVWLPTPAYDVWRAQPPARRWLALAQAWLETTRVAGLAGGRDDRDRPVAPLGPDLDRALAPEVRRQLLTELAGVPPGTAASGESLEARLQWHRPRRSALRRQLVGWTLREAELLGVVGRGALTGPARALLDGDEVEAASRLAPLLPEPLDHVLLQADLTAVAPGPLTTALAAELALAAEVESRGGATVYRFTPESVRRALDAGRNAPELHALFAAHSTTPVPQPLTYLVDDVARRHGRVRVGTASAYVRCDDEGLLGEILADRRSTALGLRRLAPTVLAAQAAVDTVLARLREMGFAPAAESAEGDVVVRRPDSRRTPVRMRPPRLVGEPPPPGEVLLGAAVRALRAGERGRAAWASDAARGESDAPGPLARMTPSEALTVLRAAARDGERLWIGYVNAEGRGSQRMIEPITVDGGFVSAFDHLREEVRTFALHRITGVRVVSEEPA